MIFKKGDIIKPIDKQGKDKLFHAAIIWDDQMQSEVVFSGIMLTSAEPSTFYNNILLPKENFSPHFKFPYKKTHFVNQIFEKFQSWGPFIKVGELTPDGIKFIEGKISKASRQSFEDYIRNCKKIK